MLLKTALFLHVISAIFWVGGMLFLTLVVVPFLKTITDPKEKSKIYQVVGTQYRFWGWVAIITLVTTGPIVLYLLYGVPPSKLHAAGISPGFDMAVFIKVCLVVIIVLSSLLHDFWLGPAARNSAKLSSIARIFGRTNLIIALLIVIFAVIIRAGGLY